MSALTTRRRWLLARVWIKDIGIGCAFIVVIVAAMYGLGHLADYCTAWGLCS